MNSQSGNYDIYDLLISLLEGDLTDFQRDHLVEWSQNDPDAAKVYHDFLRDYSVISNEIMSRVEYEYGASEDTQFDEALWSALSEQESTAQTVEIHKIEREPKSELIEKVVFPPREKRTISKFSIFSLITSAAVVLFFVVLNAFSPSQSRPVASITGNYNAVWKNLENTDGSRLWNDGSVYHLQHGIAEITFDKGAKVLIESPADLEVMDENEMFIRGRMTANVPGSAYGFTVNTINSKVVDLGTEFGLLSSDKNGTEVHVRKGKVEHEVYIANSKKPSKNLVEAGQASHADNNGGFSKERFQGAQFRWDRPMSYETAVLETKPVAYYRFEKGVEALGFDEISRTVTQSDSTGSVDFVSGPNIDPELSNQSLRLAGETGSKTFIADKAMEFTKGAAFSISLWFRPEQAKVGGQNIITYTDKERVLETMYSNQIYLTDDNRVGFYLWSDVTREPIWIETQVPVSLNQWSHVVVSYANQQVRIYVNGQLQASRTLNKDFIPVFNEGGFWAIGAETTVIRKTNRSIFKGAVDELSFYDRWLTGEEIKMLYEAAEEK